MTGRGLLVDVTDWEGRLQHAVQGLTRELAEARAHGSAEGVAEAEGRLENFGCYRSEVVRQALANPDGGVRARWVTQGTGRLEARDPPLQCVTRRYGLRRSFVTPPGHVFVAADWRSAHIVLAAALSGDEPTLSRVLSGVAYPEAGAVLSGGHPLEPGALRDLGKVALLSWLNGAAAGRLIGYATAAGVPRRRVPSHPGRELESVWPHLAAKAREVRGDKRLTTPGGRVVHVPADKGPHASQGWYWQAVEADALYAVLARSEADLGAGEHDGRAVLTLHDEVLWEVPEAGAARLVEWVGEVMDHELGRAAGVGEALVSGDGAGRLYEPRTCRVEVRRSWGGPAIEV